MSQSPRHLALIEDTGMVDGLGGANWDGAIVLGDLLESWLSSYASSDFNIHEIGAGAGLLGLLCAQLIPSLSHVLASDREPDLLLKNSKEVNVYPTIESALKGDVLNAKSNTSTTSTNYITTMELNWGEDGYAQCASITSQAHLILGAEIAVLYKQQPLMCATIDRLTSGYDGTIVMLTVDGPPLPPTDPCDPKLKLVADLSATPGKSRLPQRIPYLAQLDMDMMSRGFLVKATPAKAIVWKKLTDIISANIDSDADSGAVGNGYTVSDVTAAMDAYNIAKERDKRTPCPTVAQLVEIGSGVGDISAFDTATAAAPAPAPAAAAFGSSVADLEELCVHHIRCYYKPGLLESDNPLLSIPSVREFFAA